MTLHPSQGTARIPEVFLGIPLRIQRVSAKSVSAGKPERFRATSPQNEHFGGIESPHEAGGIARRSSVADRLAENEREQRAVTIRSRWSLGFAGEPIVDVRRLDLVDGPVAEVGKDLLQPRFEIALVAVVLLAEAANLVRDHSKAHRRGAEVFGQLHPCAKLSLPLLVERQGIALAAYLLALQHTVRTIAYPPNANCLAHAPTTLSSWLPISVAWRFALPRVIGESITSRFRAADFGIQPQRKYSKYTYEHCGLWCPEGDLNPHDRLRSADFKSAVSADFTIRAFGLSFIVTRSSGICIRLEPAGTDVRISP